MASVVFICQHGAAKSVLAARELDRLAAARGMHLEALAFGVEPDDRVASAVIEARPDLAVELEAFRPMPVSGEALEGAMRVVAIGLEPTDLASRGVAVVPGLEHWDDIPAVSEDPEAARAAIDRRIERLLDDLARERAGASP